MSLIQRTLGMTNRVRESVWSYPRPPAVVDEDREVVITHDDEEIVRSTSSLRVLETSHPPTFYIPVSDVAPGVLVPTTHRTFCEFKGVATYWDVVIGDVVLPRAAWGYAEPSSGYASLEDHVAFYPGRFDAVTVGGERVLAQEGDFYGGWITSEIDGPFKGGPGTLGW